MVCQSRRLVEPKTRYTSPGEPFNVIWMFPPGKSAASVITGTDAFETTWNGLLKPLCPLPSSQRKNMLVATSKTATFPVQTPLMNGPVLVGLMATAAVEAVTITSSTYCLL